MRKLSSLQFGKLDQQIKNDERFLFRVPLIINQALRINFGLASKMTFLLWCVCGGLLLHMFESTFFSMLIKPVYETPINTAQDVLDRGLTIIWFPGYEYYKEMAIKQNVSVVLRELAEMTYVSKVSDCFIFY